MITNIESEYITILSKNMYVYNEKKTATYILGVKIKPIISRKWNNSTSYYVKTQTCRPDRKFVSVFLFEHYI